MRWTDFFSHLEHNFSLDAYPPHESVLDQPNPEAHLLDWCLAAKAERRPITVAVMTGDVFHVSPRAVGVDWFSGLVGGEHGSGMVIPLTAIVWIEGGDGSAPRHTGAPVAAPFRVVVADMARRRAVVMIRTATSDVAGVIVGVGEGFCDVAAGPTGPAGSIRRFPFRSIVAIFQGTGGWG